MDDLTLLREFDRDIAGPSADVLTASRRTLDAATRRAEHEHEHAHASVDSRRTRGFRPLASSSLQLSPRSPRRRAMLASGALLAACTAVALLLTGLTPATRASAAEVLRVAATAAQTADPSTGGVRTHSLQFVQSSSDGRADAAGMMVMDQSVLVERTVTLRAAVNGTDWTRTWSGDRPLQAWGRDAQQLMDQTSREAVEGSTDRASADPEFWSGLGPAQVRAMPRDPAALLQELRATPNDVTSAQTTTRRAILAAARLLGSGLADPELQSATYRALEMLPDLQATSGADIDGRPGVVISIQTSTWRSELIIDPKNGRYLGSTGINLKPKAGAPAGTVDEGTAVYTE